MKLSNWVFFYRVTLPLLLFMQFPLRAQTIGPDSTAEGGSSSFYLLLIGLIFVIMALGVRFYKK
jgi:hypothetical protein